MTVRRLGFLLILALFLIGLFLFLGKARVITVATIIEEVTKEAVIVPPVNADIEPQRPLANPPSYIKAVYVTSWSAGNEKQLAYLIDLVKTTELNALVIDVKDVSGYVSYNTDLELPKKYAAVKLRIPKLNQLIKRLHDEGIYLIGRLAVFQDQRLALARPDLALYSSTTGEIWKDYKGLMWLDVASQEVWDYNLSIAKEILDRGFDEVNFDYIRFPSDGNLDDIKYPFWDEKRLKTHVVREFFQYAREKLPGARISADLFGLATVNTDGMGIGQQLEFAMPYFDAVAPMIYPSHYFKGFMGYKNPADYPYEVVRYSLESAVARINQFRRTASTTPIGKLRPWLQDFDLGADYDAAMVRKQIRAIYDVASSSLELFDGWMLWNASNIYTKEALLPE